MVLDDADECVVVLDLGHVPFGVPETGEFRGPLSEGVAADLTWEASVFFWKTLKRSFSGAAGP